MRVRRVLLLLGIAAAAWSLGAPVHAQDQAPIVPPELAPVFGLIGPTVSPVCGGVGIVGLLGPAALGPLTTTVLPLTGPVFVLCGAIPRTPDEKRYSCTLDRQALDLIASITNPLAGIGPVFDIRPVGQVLEQVAVITDLLPPPAKVDDLITQAAVVLQCEQGVSGAPAPGDGVVPGAPVPTTSPEPNVLPPAVAPILPSVPLAPFAPLPTPVLTVPPTRAVGVVPAVSRPVPRVPFSYAAVFLLPFVALLGGASVGRSLLRPVATNPVAEPTPRRS